MMRNKQQSKQGANGQSQNTYILKIIIRSYLSIKKRRHLPAKMIKLEDQIAVDKRVGFNHGLGCPVVLNSDASRDRYIALESDISFDRQAGAVDQGWHTFRKSLVETIDMAVVSWVESDLDPPQVTFRVLNHVPVCVQNKAVGTHCHDIIAFFYWTEARRSGFNGCGVFKQGDRRPHG